MANYISDLRNEKKNNVHFIILISIILLCLSPGLSFGEEVVVSWDANTEQDLLGYKICYGTSSRSYSTIIDVGNVLEFQIDILSTGATYFFAVVAYDTAYNVSNYSAEVSITLSDTSQTPDRAPNITDVVFVNLQTIKVYFSQEMKESGITNPANYIISPAVQIVAITADQSLMSVEITTSAHQTETDYTIMIQGVENSSGVSIQQVYTKSYRFQDPFTLYVEKMEMISLSILKLYFSKRLAPGSITGTGNFLIRPATEIYSVDIDTSFKIITLHTQPHQYDIQNTIEIKDLYDVAQNFIPDNYRIKYEFQKQVSVDSISIGNYKSAILSINDLYYVDRDYRLENVPENLLGSTWIKTRNGDKTSTGETFLSFSVSDNVIIYVGYDQRILTLPVWLQEWTETDSVIRDDQYTSFRCYAKAFSAGKVVLGGNYGFPRSNMYVILIKGNNNIEYPDTLITDNKDPVILDDFELLQNYPNPFSAGAGAASGGYSFTEIPFIANSQDHVTLTIFDLLGRVVKKFEIDVAATGQYQINWDATCQDGLPVSSGIYIYRLQTSTFHATKKMTIMR